MSMLSSARRRLLIDLCLLALSAIFLVSSAQLIAAHAKVIGDMRHTALPIASRMPALQERLAVLKSQVQAAKATEAGKSGPLRESLRAYVLPSDGVKRSVATVSALGDTLRSLGELRSLSSISVGDTEAADLTLTGATLNMRTLDVSMEVTQDGLEDFLHATDLSGLLTVADALSKDQITKLLALTERENPMGVIALQQYFSTDLVEYLRHADLYDRRLLAGFSSGTFASDFASIVHPAFVDGQALVGKKGISDLFSQQGFWPMPFLEVKKAEVSDLADGWLTLSLHLVVLGSAS